MGGTIGRMIGVWTVLGALLVTATPLAAADNGDSEDGTCDELPDGLREACKTLMDIVPICEGEDIIDCVLGQIEDVCIIIADEHVFDDLQAPVVFHPDQMTDFGILVGPIPSSDFQFTYFYFGVSANGNCD